MVPLKFRTPLLFPPVPPPVPDIDRADSRGDRAARTGDENADVAARAGVAAGAGHGDRGSARANHVSAADDVQADVVDAATRRLTNTGDVDIAVGRLHRRRGVQEHTELVGPAASAGAVDGD